MYTQHTHFDFPKPAMFRKVVFEVDKSAGRPYCKNEKPRAVDK